MTKNELYPYFWLSFLAYQGVLVQSAAHEEIYTNDDIRFRFSWLRSEVNPCC